VGVKEATGDKKVLDAAGEQLAAITGQKPVVRRAKKSIAAFKLREGAPIGLSVTLRGKRMWDFLEKVVTIVLPRVRDFRGVARESFDGRGNYTLGLKEQIVFPEIDYAKIDKIRGLEVTIATTARDNRAGMALLEELGMPFQKHGEKI
jgi:large subunit ribosomal protein L5